MDNLLRRDNLFLMRLSFFRVEVGVVVEVAVEVSF